MSEAHGRHFKSTNRNHSQSAGENGKRDDHQAAVVTLAEYIREDLAAVASSFGEKPANLLSETLGVLASGDLAPGIIPGM